MQVGSEVRILSSPNNDRDLSKYGLQGTIMDVYEDKDTYLVAYTFKFNENIDEFGREDLELLR